MTATLTTLEAIEAAVSDEAELRRLLHRVERDDRLDDEDREWLARRAAFYLDDQFGRGDEDVLAPVGQGS